MAKFLTLQGFESEVLSSLKLIISQHEEDNLENEGMPPW